MTNTHITEFLATSDSWDDSQDYASALWVRGANTWNLLSTHDDPYSAVLPMVEITDKPVILEMFGWMRPFTEDEDGEMTVEDDAERIRCRILFSLDGDTPTATVQQLGSTDFIHDDSMEGLFMDFVTSARVRAGKG